MAETSANKQFKLIEAGGAAPHKIDDLRARRTDELIIAFVGPVGSGCSRSAAIFKKLLQTTYKYEEVVEHRVSALIVEYASLAGESYEKSLHGTERVRKLQDIGNKLRQKFSNDYLVAKVIERIAEHRLKKGGLVKAEGGNLVPEPKRWAHIIDSLKNPAELSLLREVYGDMLWVIGIFAPEEVRRNRLRELEKWDSKQITDLFDRDAKQELHYGQGVRDTFFQADFFIRNDGENDDALNKTIERHLEVIFGAPARTPTQEESAMYAAYAAASRSACLSRQVGASIVSPTGEVIGIGWNDVPQFGGGLYSTEDGENDHRCFKWGARICHNDDRKNRLYEDIFAELKPFLKSDVSLDQAREALRKTDVRQLIEFSRSVHAEMEALLSVARGHKAGILEATLYCTTFPCHSCARHLLAAGIKKVVYIEPYPKSLALDLHRDATSVVRKDGAQKMVLEQYEGVSPRNLLRLFKPVELNRKINGKLIDFSPSASHPTSLVSVDDFSTHEKRILARLKNIETPGAPA